jgi:hypothetical protein
MNHFRGALMLLAASRGVLSRVEDSYGHIALLAMAWGVGAWACGLAFDAQAGPAARLKER